MIEFEADDALAAGAATATLDRRVEQVIICTPDKDLAQCVRGTRVVQLNRRTRVIIDEAGVIGKFGVPPRPFRITWHWSAIRRTDIQACKAGAQNHLLLFLPSTVILKNIPKDTGSGVLRSPADVYWLKLSAANGIRPFSFANSPPCERISNFLMMSTSCAGTDRPQHTTQSRHN